MSDTIILTAKQIDRELRRLAKEQPEFRYNPERVGLNDDVPLCYYSSGLDGGPECSGCIFGQALQRLGVPVDLLEKADQSPDSIYYLSLEGVCFPRGPEQPRYWLRIQRAQDRGATWVEAVAEHMPAGAGRGEGRKEDTHAPTN